MLRNGNWLTIIHPVVLLGSGIAMHGLPLPYWKMNREVLLLRKTSYSMSAI